MEHLHLPLEQLPNPLPVDRLTAPFRALIDVPGSKSITNRAYVLAALANGISRLNRPLRSDDCDGLLSALETLGARVHWEGDDVLITGVNGRFPRGGEINLGDGGTPTRFMIAAACLSNSRVVVDGSARMRERPVAEGVEMLRQLGAVIDYIEHEGRLPVRITPTPLFTGGELMIGHTASSQFMSAVLLIAPSIERGVRLHFVEPPTSAQYIRLTMNMMSPAWGLLVEQDSALTTTWPSTRVPHGRRPAVVYDIEPDASSAAYWSAAAAIVPGSSIEMRLTLDTVQPDIAIPRMLVRYGCVMEETCRRDGQARSSTSILRGPAEVGGFRTLNAEQFPDGAMALAVVATQAKSPSLITGLGTLRVKETDRIAALATELRKVGASVKTTESSIAIDPSTMHDRPVVIETYNDHRMAMAFAVLGLARGNVSIRDPHVVAKSYPGFWSDLASLYAPSVRG